MKTINGQFTRVCLIAGVLAFGSFATGVLGLTGQTTAADISVIEKRKDTMEKVVLKNFVVVKDFVKKGKGSAADVGKAADALVAVAAKIPALFPKGTGRPDVDAKTTRALPKIWEDWTGFEAAAKSLGAEAAKLSMVAAKGGKEEIAAQFIATGKKGCGGCHKSFRGKKVK